jgi:hypothetical protein
VQIGKGFVVWDRLGRLRPSAESDQPDPGDDWGAGEGGNVPARGPDRAERPESIRDVQRRRRGAERLRSDVKALLAAPDEEDDEEDSAGPTDSPLRRVFVVFRGARWDDPDGALRESDSIVGVYATEDAARRAVVGLSTEAADRDDAWYQPYPVQS